MRRVVVTGMGGVCGLGASWPEIEAGLRARRNSIRTMHEWDRYTEMNTRLGGPIDSFAPPVHWTRKQLRSMGRVSQFAVSAAELAITNAGLLGDAAIRCGATGVACGSSTGSPPDTKDFQVMEMALADAGVTADAIGYVNGHGAATEHGDIAETRATSALFGPHMPLSSQKSYLGHTLGACGALEAWFTIEMMNDGWFAPTLNLDNVDPRCGELDYILGDGRELDIDYAMSNNFAFGGVNTSLVFRRWRPEK